MKHGEDGWRAPRVAGVADGGTTKGTAVLRLGHGGHAGSVGRQRRIRCALASALLLVGFTCQSAQADVPTPATAEFDQYVWDLSPLYASDAAWEADRTLIVGALSQIGELKGTLGASSQCLLAAMNRIADLRQRSANLLEYAILVSYLNANDAIAAARLAAANGLSAQVEAAVTFADFEVLALGESTLERFFREQPALETHRLRIHKILYDGPHLATPEAEAILRAVAPWPTAAAEAYFGLFASQLPWPSVSSAGAATIRVDDGSYKTLRADRRSGVRHAAEARYLGVMRRYEPLFGKLLDGRIEAELTIARSRQFADGLDAELYSEGLPPAAVGVMVRVARAHRDTLQRYEALRARAVGATESYADAHVAPPPLNAHFSVADTYAAIIAMAAPIGAAYQQQLQHELARPWIHLPPWPQKSNTYGNWGNNIGGKPTFGFMKYDGSYRSAQNLAGLAIDLMMKETMPKDRPTDTRVDPAVYGNAVVFAGNILHNDYLRAHAFSRHEQLIYLVGGLDRLRQIMFDEAITMELEMDVQRRIVAGHAPNGAQISSIYLGLLREYYASSTSVQTVPEEFAIDWTTDFLPFDSFEDVNFPMAMAAACALVEGVRAGDERAGSAFAGVRGQIGSAISYDLLKASGVDLATNEPYEAAMRRMRELLSALEAILTTPS